MPDSLGDRMKIYEKTFSHKLVKNMPLIIRVDGKAFHTFTKKMEKPFDRKMMEAMVSAATYTAVNIQGFKVGYVQSDEATFCLTDYDSHETEGWFGYKLNKVVSISASIMSVAFNKYYLTSSYPVFDSRAFTVPKEEIVNVLLWRAKDWLRNSLQMYCSYHFSHKELHKKNRAMMHEMLHEKGLNWANDLSEREKNGTYILNDNGNISLRSDILPSFDDIDSKINHLI